MSITRSSPVQVAAYSTTYSQAPKLVSTSWSKVSVGPSHVLAIRSNNTLWAWGINTNGQLGDGTTISRSSPVQIGNPSYTWNDISAGVNYSIGLRGDNLLFTWGINTAGMIGDLNVPVNSARSSPIQIGASSWTQISAGVSHVVAIRSDRQLFAWGFNNVGQLGTGDYITRSSPVQVSTSSWSSVSAGLNYTTAITTNGKLFTWGDNTVGTLGYTTPAQPYFSWTSIAGNDDFTIAIRNDGLLFGWGTNSLGQLGLNDTVLRSSPTQIGTNSWTVVSVNGLGGTVNESVAAIRSDGTLWTWGYNGTGGLGDGTTLNRSSPVQVSGGGLWSTVASGRSHKIGIKTDGTLYAWGLNTSGQLGIVNENGYSWRQLSVGLYYTLAIRSDYKLFAWGTNAFGELGVNDTARRSSPVQVGATILPTTSWLQVSAGGGANAPQGGHVLAIDSFGRLYAWGLNNIGQLGLGDVQPRSNPTQITSIVGESFASISAYNSASSAISTINKLYAWGQNSYQEIGDGTTIHRSTPVQIGGSSWAFVAAGNFSRYAIDSNYNLYAWGRNDVGQLGLNDVVQRSSPTQVTTVVTSWTSIAAGSSHAVGIDINNRMYGWGWNGYGQLGDNTTANRSNPVQMGAGSSWIQAASGTHQTLMLRSDYTYWGTGYNNDGQLGDLTTRWRSAPVQIFSSNVNNQVSWTQLSSARGEGTGDGGGIASDGSLWRWGYNGYGQLGLNNTTANFYSPILVYSSQESRSSPVQIGIGYSWTKVGIADLASYAIRADSTLWAWGNNSAGVLGNHDIATFHRSSPVQIGSDTGWTNIFGYGASHVHAIRSFKLFAWGLNTGGQLGIGQATVARSSPVQVGTSSWLTLSAYGTGNNTLGITTDGSLYAWGNKTNLLLGEFSNASFTYSWAQISTGITHTAAIRNDGTLWTWGVNASGQLGDYSTTDRNSPVQVYTTVLGEQWNNVSVSGPRTYAIRQDGTMWAWGDNTNNMLGDGTSASRSYPVQILSNNALTSNRGAGSVYFEYTGTNSNIRITGSDFNISTNPYLFEAWLYPTKLVYNNQWPIIGQNGTTANGCWGLYLNFSSVGGQHKVFIDSYGVNNNLWYVPEQQPNKWYHLVVVRNANSEIAVFWNGIRAIPDGNVTVNASGYATDTRNFNAIVDTIGWTGGNGSPFPGYISNLRFIIGPDASNIYDPRQSSITVPTSPLAPRPFLAGNKYLLTCQGYPIIDATGSYGLTINNIVNTTDFSPFTSSQTTGVSFTSVKAGLSHTLALDSNNKLWGWGSNDYKQLGSIVSWRTISTGASHAVYLRSDGSLFGTGANDAGQLGDGTVTTRSSPVQLSALRFNSIASGSNHNIGILFDGTLWAWGLNSSGQLGTGDSINRSNPVQIGRSSWSSVAAGASHSVALNSSNLMYVWGNNTNGQIGLSDTITRYSPNLVGTGSVNSVFFNGTTDYFALGGQANFSFSTGDWTIECWIYITTYATTFGVIYDGRGAGTAATNNYVNWGVTSTGNLYYYTAGASPAIAGGVININTWYHVALSRVSSNTRMFINGVQTGSTLADSQTYTIGSARPTVGTDGNSPLSAGYIFSGLISNLRVIKNQGLFTGTFTPSTSALTNNTVGHTGTGAAATLTGTVALLTCQDKTIIDNSGSALTISLAGAPFGTPATVPFSNQVLTTSSWTSIFAGNNRTFGILTNSTLYAWGLNTSGELGVTDIISRSSPVQVSGGLSWSSVSTGTSHTVAITNLGLLYAWGGNSAGQLGDSTTVSKSSPTQIDSTSSYSLVAATALSSMARRIDGRLFVWGSNLSPNNLGLNNTVSRSSPVQLNTSSYTLVPSSSGSSTFTNIADVEGELWGWGENNKGQLGQWQSIIGDTVNRSSPVQIGSNVLTSNITKLLGKGIRPIILDNTNSFTQISAGGTHSLAIRNNSTLYGWGDNTVGQVGNSATLNKSWIAVYSPGANDTNTYALRQDRILYAWGYNGYGQIGTGDVIDRSSPVQVMTDKSWSHVAMGGSYTVGITTDGLLWSWGDNSAGQLGDWVSTAIGARRSSPVQIGTSSWTLVSANNSVVMAIKADGTLWGWGRNEQGQLGNNSTTPRSSPTQVSGGGSWLTVTAGLASSIGIKIDGSLWAWGYDTDGQMGQNSSGVPRSNPVQILPGQSFISTGSITGYTNYAIRNDYTLWGWGWNGWGQLGINVTGNMSSPVQVPVAGSIIQVVGGYDETNSAHAYFLNNEGVLFAAGNNPYGDLGDMTVTPRSNPVQVGSIFGPLGYNSYNSANPINYSFTFVAAFRYGGYAIASGPNVTGLYGWGVGDQTQLGLGIAGGTVARRSSPAQIASTASLFLPTYVSSPTQIGTSSYSIISAGLSYSAAITTDFKLFTWGDNSRLQLGSVSLANAIGTAGNQNSNAGAFIRNTDGGLFLWGANDVGQLGNGTTGNASSPMQIGLGNSTSSWKKIARAKVASAGHTLGIKQDGTLWAWGNNNNGQLGIGVTINKSSPIQIGTATNWNEVAAGISHSLAIKSDGSLWGWGMNTSGQAGQIRWAKISSGTSHTLAIRSDGQMFAWGNNTYGQIGDVTNVSRSSPVQIGGGQIAPGYGGYIWSDVTAGIDISAALRSDGTLWTWGRNNNGQLGDLSTTDRNSPVIVGGTTLGVGQFVRSWSQVSARDYMVAVRSDGALFAWGTNTSGVLSQGETTNRSSPVQIGITSDKGFSSQFNGTSNYLQATVTSPGTLNFTIEAWIYLPAYSTGSPNIFSIVGSGSDNGFQFYVTQTIWGVRSNTTTYLTGTGPGPLLNTWYHVALVRNSGAMTIFVNGNIIITGNDANTARNFTDTQFNIGFAPVGQYLNAFITNVRYIRNQALYTGTFVPGTSPLTNSTVGTTGTNVASSITGTVILLTCQDISGFIDNSGNNLTVTSTGAGTKPGQGVTPFTLQRFNSVTAGLSHVLAITTTNTLYAWGVNNSGQLGLGDTITRSSPVQIGTSSYSIARAGNLHSAVITTDGKLFTWGDNTYAQLGLGDTITRSSPVQIGTSSWTNVYAGTNYNLALSTNNTVFAWGDGTKGNLGIYNNLSWTLGNGTFTHSNDFTLWSWGDNSFGQLGISSTQYRSSPVQIGTTSWTYTYSTTSNAYAIKSDGSMWAWGLNYLGQLGLNDTVNRSSPVQIGSDTNWSTVVASGSGHALALKTTGTLWAWGNNSYNELGQNEFVAVHRSSPVQIGSSSWTKVSAGNNYSYAIRSGDTALFTWGRNDWGQSGLNNNTSLSWTTVATGDSYSVAIRSDGKLFSWGVNNKGQLGLGHTVSKSAPTQIAVSTNYNLYSTVFTGSTPADYLSIASNAAFAFGTGNFTIECWFYSTNITATQAIYDTRNPDTANAGFDLFIISSKLSFGTNATTYIAGVTTLFSYTWYHIAVVRTSTTAITMYLNGVQEGTTYTASATQNFTNNTPRIGNGVNGFFNGYISNIRLNNGNAVYTSNFIVPTSTLTNITGTVLLTCQNDRFIDNSTANGGVGFTITQNGTGIATTTLTPFVYTAQPNYSFTQVSTLISHTVAIRNDGALFTWGANDVGQLGQGDTVTRSAPLQVGSSSWTNVFAGLNSTYAIRTDGALFTAGDNTYGQLSQNDTTARSTLVQISGTTSWTNITASTTGHALGITNTGALFAWGYNQYNELGLNVRVPTIISSPVQVGSSSWTKVSAGNNFTLGILSTGALYGWGRNDWGQVSVNTGTVLTALSWTQITNGDSFTMAIRTDGKLFGWGRNDKGQLGLGNTVNKSAPTQIALSNNFNNFGASFTATGSDYLTMPTTGNLLDWGASANYTIEAWINSSAFTATESTAILARRNPTTTSTDWQLQIGTTGLLSLYNFNGGASVTVTSTVAIKLYTWNHVAVTINAGTASLFINGSLVCTPTAMPAASNNQSTNYVIVASNNVFSTCRITNLRVVGSALYTTAFTPSTSPLTAIANTRLLTLQNSGNFIDNSTNNIVLTPFGTSITTTELTPFARTVFNYSWTQVSATNSHIVAIRNDGTLWAWGANNSGQLGQSDTANRSAPVQIGTSSWTKISAGFDNSFAIRTDGALFGWGDNTNGILGQNDTVSRSSVLQIGTSSWTNISATQHILATLSTGAMYAWGLNNAGQLGLTATGDTINRSSPVQVGTSSWNLVSAGSSFSMATLSTGVLFTWGLGTSGQLGGAGNGTTTAYGNTSRSSPSQIGASSWSAIASGTSWAAGISAFRLFGWGGSVNWENGLGTTALRSSPVQIGTSSWIAIGGTANPVGITLPYSLFGWGTQTAGQLGLGDTVLRSQPTQIASLTGQIIDNTSSPTQIGTSSWTQVAAGTSWSGAIDTTGRLFTWGFGFNGELASGATTARSSPVQVGALTTWSRLAGTTHVLGTLTTGTSTLVAWGTGTSGQLGNNTVTSVSSPVAVSGLLTNLTLSMTNSPTQIGTSSWTQISAGDYHILALRYLDGGLFTWGRNDQGQLGSAVTTARSSPVQVGTTNWSTISAGNSFSASITTLGGLFTWGLNNFGQLGSAVTTARSAPVQLGTSSWTSVSASKDGMFAITISNQLYAWGNNNLGQLGLGDTQLRSSPVQVGTNIQTLYSNPTQITTGSIVSSSSSVYFNSGTTDYIIVTGSSGFNIASNSSNYTIEAWVYPTSTTGIRTIVAKDWITGNYPSWGLSLTASNTIEFDIGSGIASATGYQLIAGTNPVLLNAWSHVAVVITGNTTCTMYINGVLDKVTAITGVQGLGTNNILIGQNGQSVQYFAGYISNLRITKSLVYTANFTPSTSPFTTSSQGVSSANVGLLTLQSSTLVDNSPNNYILYPVNNPIITNNSFTQVSAGVSHSAFINSEGALVMSGDNIAGQLGDSTTVAKSFTIPIGYATLYDTRSSPAQIGTGSWSQIAAGLNYSVAIKSDGTLYVWGDNTNGNLGIGTTTLLRSPNQVGTSSWISVTSGGSHTVAMRTDQTLFAWGLNNAGQLGDNSTINRSSPVQVNTGLVTSWNSVSAGASHTLAIDATNNFPYGWGLNSSGQIGDSTLVSRSTPAQVNTGTGNYSYQFNGTTQYLSIASNAAFTFGTGDFTIEFWFYGASQLNAFFYDNRGATSATYPHITTGASTATLRWGPTNTTGTIIIGNSTWHHCAITRQSGTVKLWVDGVLDTSVADSTNYSTNYPVYIGSNSYTPPANTISGYISNLRVVKGTALYTTGFYPSTGALTTTSQGATISQVSLLTAQSATIVDNSSNVFTITNTGTVTVSTTNPFGPYYSAGFNGSTQQLVVTDNIALRMSTGDFTIECWVYSTTSQVANSGIISKGDPTTNTGFTLNVTGTTLFENRNNITTGSGAIPIGIWTHIAWVRASGVAYLYVNGIVQATKADTYDYSQTSSLRIGVNRNVGNFAGYISNMRIVKGTAVYTGNFTVPGNILRTTQSASTNITALTGTETSLLTLQNATIVDNSTNAFTITNSTSVSTTTAYAPFSASTAGVNTNWDLIQAGASSSMGFSNNTLYTWGSNTSGQLGDNTIATTINKSAPQAVGGRLYNVPLSLKYSTSPIQIASLSSKSWSLVATGTSHVTAMATDYSLWTWGYNTYGQFGDNTTVNKSSPVQVTGITMSFSQLTAATATLGVRATVDKLLYGWGQGDVTGGYALAVDNRSNPTQIYTGTMANPLLPIKLSTVTGSSFTLVQTGSAVTALASTGLLYTWGTNTNGQLGDNTVISRSSPIQVGGLLVSNANSPIQLGSSSYSQVSAGYSHVLAINTNGLLYAWGKTPANGQSVNRSSPVQIGSNSWLFISAGLDASQAIDSTRTLYTWGLNTNYQLGSANFFLNQSVSSPVAIGTLAIPNSSHTISVGSGNGGFVKNI